MSSEQKPNLEKKITKLQTLNQFANSSQFINPKALAMQGRFDPIEENPLKTQLQHQLGGNTLQS